MIKKTIEEERKQDGEPKGGEEKQRLGVDILTQSLQLSIPSFNTPNSKRKRMKKRKTKCP